MVRLLKEMRLDGDLPFDWIADNTRWMRKPTTFSGPEDALRHWASAEASGLQSAEARRLIDDANRQIRESFSDITSDQELDDHEVVLALTELEVHSQRLAVQAPKLELAHVQEQLKELYEARGAKVVHVVRSDDGNIISLVGINGTAA